MIEMALLSVIGRYHFRDGMPIREIERRTALSRNTIRKYLRAGDVKPRFKVPDRPSQLDAFAGKLTAWLRVEVGRSRKQRRTAKRMHADPVVLGYGGSYNRVAAFVRAWKAARGAGQQPRHIRASDLRAGRSVPVRLERGLGGAGRRAYEAS